MEGVNIHIYQSDITKESRMFKISNTLERITNFESIILAGIQGDGLQLSEKKTKITTIRRAPLFGLKNRILHYLLYYFWLIYLITSKKPKVLNIHSLELLPYAFYAKLFFRSKVIYDAHELETEKMGMSHKRKKISIVIEKLFIKYCDVVIVVGDAIAEHYKNIYPSMPKPEVVLNTPYLREVNKYNKFRERFNINPNTTICLYQGVLNKGRGIECILSAFEKSENNNVVVVFLGYGPYEARIKKACLKSKNIYFHEAVSPKELMEYTSSADIGLCLIENKCLSYYYSLPNKMFEYTMAGLPVITSDGYEMKKLVNRHNIGYVIKENNEEELLNVIDKLTSKKILDLILNIEKFRIEYNWENQEYILERIYKNI